VAYPFDETRPSVCRERSVARVEREFSERILLEERLHVGALTRFVPGDGSEIEETMLGPAREETEDVAQIGPRLDVAESAAREEGGEEGVDGATVVAADEEPVLAADGLAAQRELAHVVVDG